MTNKKFALVLSALLIGGLQYSPATYATLMACSEPAHDPAGTLDCGAFLGANPSGAVGGGGNPTDPIYWNDDVDSPLFGNPNDTKYSLVAHWDFGGGWNNAYASGGIGDVEFDEDGEPRSGTWTLPFGVDLMAIKGGNGHGLYHVGGASSGDWSAYWGLPLVGKGKVPEVSNIRWFSSEKVEVPEPGTLLLLGGGFWH